MKNATLFLFVSLLVCQAQAADMEGALAVVAELGQANGQALACGEKGAASRAKNLMLLHAPKTQRFGDAFEQATQQGFLGQTKGQACPDAPALAGRIDVVAERLRELLPVAPK